MHAPETTILKELIATGDAFASGKILAERLGVSRVAVWSHIEKLRTAGFDVEARPRLGYRLRQVPDQLNRAFLQALLPTACQELTLHFHETIDSTNSEAERLLAGGEPTPFVVLSRAQTGGRGRLGRRWFSADHGNLYLTFVFQPRLPPQQMQTFTLWMGAAICDFLNQRENVPVQLKWPNDLLLDQKKIGGMLTEARVDHDQIRDLVFGLGLNVNGRRESLPAELREIATSIAAGAGRSLRLNEFAAALIHCVFEAYRVFTRRSHEEDFRRFWSRYDALFGEPVTACQGSLEVSGIARGIDEDGCLLLAQANGSHHRVSAGDVTLQRQSAP